MRGSVPGVCRDPLQAYAVLDTGRLLEKVCICLAWLCHNRTSLHEGGARLYSFLGELLRQVVFALLLLLQGLYIGLLHAQRLGDEVGGGHALHQPLHSCLLLCAALRPCRSLHRKVTSVTNDGSVSDGDGDGDGDVDGDGAGVATCLLQLMMHVASWFVLVSTSYGM